MSCDCGQCREHYRTLGIGYGIPSESEIQDAYREAVKQWHPDLYENFASLRADAEERFKQIQVAFRELGEHNALAVETPVESAAAEPTEEKRSISFGDAPGCQAGPHFTPEAEEIVNHHLGKLGTAQAIVDLTGARSHTSTYAQFMLLGDLGMIVRDARNIFSLLWYKDLGEINLIRKQGPSKPSMWQSFVGGISGAQPKCVLQINRINGTLFYSLSREAEDSVKEVICEFLQRKKSELHS